MLTQIVNNKRVSSDIDTLYNLCKNLGSPLHLMQYFFIDIGFQLYFAGSKSTLRKHNSISNLFFREPKDENNTYVFYLENAEYETLKEYVLRYENEEYIGNTDLELDQFFNLILEDVRTLWS